LISTSDVRHFACVWFVPGARFDFMGVLYQKHDARWECKYRFRYYAATGDDDDDEKSWYVIEFEEGKKVPEMEEIIDDVIHRVFDGRIKKGDIEKVEVRGDAEKFVEVMAKQSWTKLKFEGMGPAAKA
jgi:hypothetical protein